MWYDAARRAADMREIEVLAEQLAQPDVTLIFRKRRWRWVLVTQWER